MDVGHSFRPICRMDIAHSTLLKTTHNHTAPSQYITLPPPLCCRIYHHPLTPLPILHVSTRPTRSLRVERHLIHLPRVLPLPSLCIAIARFFALLMIWVVCRAGGRLLVRVKLLDVAVRLLLFMLMLPQELLLRLRLLL